MFPWEAPAGDGKPLEGAVNWEERRQQPGAVKILQPLRRAPYADESEVTVHFVLRNSILLCGNVSLCDDARFFFFLIFFLLNCQLNFTVLRDVLSVNLGLKTAASS